MNVFVVMLALAWPGEATVVTPPVLLAQQGAMQDHDHAHGEEGHEHDFEQFPAKESSFPRESYFEWMLRALGIRYTMLFFLTGPLVFLGSVLLVAMCKRPAPIAAFFPFVFIPFLIGVFGFFDGAIASFSVIASSPVSPKPSEIAHGISTALATPLVGLFLTAPSFLILSLGLFIRSLLYRGPAKDPYAK